MILLLLAVAVYLDDYQVEQSAEEQSSVAIDASIDDQRVTTMQRFVMEKDRIETAYQNLAVDYAVHMAELATFSTQSQAPADVIMDLIRQRVAREDGVTIKRMSAGEVRNQGEGVHKISTSIELESLTHQGAIHALMGLGVPSEGLAWESFSLHADADKHKVNISGRILGVVIEAAE